MVRFCPSILKQRSFHCFNRECILVVESSQGVYPVQRDEHAAVRAPARSEVRSCCPFPTSTWPNSPFFQLMLTEDTFHITAGRDITDQVNVVQSVGEYRFPFPPILACNIRSSSAAPSVASTSRMSFHFPHRTSTPSSPLYIVPSPFPQFRFPTVLLLSAPVTVPPLSPSRVDDHMTPYTSDLIAMKRSIAANQYRADPFRCLVDVDAMLPPTPAGPSDDASEWYVETAEDGVDQALFPRTMGYLVLESQYRQ